MSLIDPRSTHQGSSRQQSPWQAVRKARPTLRGTGILLVAAVVLAGAGFSARADLLFIGIFLAILPLGAMIAVAVRRPQLTVSRSVSPDIIEAGDTADVTLNVANQASVPATATIWRDCVPPHLIAQDADRLPSMAAHGGTRSRSDSVALHHVIGSDHRGLYQIGPMIVGSTDPFSLAYAEHTAGVSRHLIVTPQVTELAETGAGIASSDGTVHELLQNTSPSADELMAREYRPGDPLRRVHWRATARHGELMVRQEERSSNPEAWVVFDTARDPRAERTRQANGDEDPAFEDAVRLAASIGVHLIEDGFTICVLETGQEQLSGRSGASRSGTMGSRVPSFEAPGGDRMLLAGLADIRQRDDGRVEYPSLLAGALRNAGQTMPVFLILVEPVAEDLGALAAIRPLCAPAVAFLVGPAAVSGQRRLEDAGWTCVQVADRSQIPGAWLAALTSNALTSSGSASSGPASSGPAANGPAANELADADG